LLYSGKTSHVLDAYGMKSDKNVPIQSNAKFVSMGYLDGFELSYKLHSPFCMIHGRSNHKSKSKYYVAIIWQNDLST